MLRPYLARICGERGYERPEWVGADRNAPSIAFYESLGARPQDEWTVYRLTDGAPARLGGGRVGGGLTSAAYGGRLDGGPRRGGVRRYGSSTTLPVVPRVSRARWAAAASASG